jgi:hypothetical protein
MTTKSTPMEEKAKQAFDNLLDGGAPSAVTPEELGPFGDCYAEMLRAHDQGSTAAVRQVFLRFAELDQAFAMLRAAGTLSRRQGWTVRELLETEFPDPKWAVPGLLPIGLTMLAGRPKLGKSWLSLQMAIAVGTGGKLLGLDVPKGKVLYLALEDSARRLKKRLEQQQAPKETDVKLYDEWPLLEDGGIVSIFQAVNEHGYNLVIIDTISRALGRADQMDQGEMSSLLGSLQRLAMDREITLLLVDHHRKAGSNGDGDVIDDVMGATSKVGVADAAMGLYRRRGERTATLKVTGRDIDDREMIITFDRELCCWQYEGEAEQVKSNTVQAEILEALEQLGGKATKTQVARFLGKQPSNISAEMNELVMKGRVTRGARDGREIPYILVDEPDEEDHLEDEDYPTNAENS